MEFGVFPATNRSQHVGTGRRESWHEDAGVAVVLCSVRVEATAAIEFDAKIAAGIHDRGSHQTQLEIFVALANLIGRSQLDLVAIINGQ